MKSFGSWSEHSIWIFDIFSSFGIIDVTAWLKGVPSDDFDIFIE